MKPQFRNKKTLVGMPEKRNGSLATRHLCETLQSILYRNPPPFGKWKADNIKRILRLLSVEFNECHIRIVAKLRYRSPLSDVLWLTAGLPMDSMPVARDA